MSQRDIDRIAEQFRPKRSRTMTVLRNHPLIAIVLGLLLLALCWFAVDHGTEALSWFESFLQ